MSRMTRESEDLPVIASQYSSMVKKVETEDFLQIARILAIKRIRAFFVSPTMSP